MASTPTGPGDTEYAGFWVTHTNGTEFEIKPYVATVTGAQADTALQSLVNHLQAWEDLVDEFTVSATKKNTEGHVITADEVQPL